MMFSSATVFSVIIGALTLAAPAHAQPQTFGKATILAKVEDQKLSKEQKQGFNNFRKNKTYFGAYYVSLDGTEGFFVKNFNSLEIAKRAAKKGCEIVSMGSNCRLYAVMVPKGIDPNGDAEGLGAEASRAFALDYPAQQIAGTHGAFAISRAAVFGYSFGWDSRAEARATAVSYCQAGVAKLLAKLTIEGRKWAQSQGYTTCVVVDEIGPN